jgi:chromosome segregation ATPase
MDSPKAGAQPENHAAWADACKDLIGKAKSDTNELVAALGDTSIKHIVSPKNAATGGGGLDKGPKNRAELDDRAQVTKMAINTVETAIQKASGAVHKLQHERQKKWAGLKVCEWRIALRQRRPPQELFNDHLQEALEAEVQALNGSRAVIAEKIAQGKAIIEDCEANKARLTRNVRYMVTYGTGKVPDHAEAEASTEAPTQTEEAPPGPPRPAVPASNEGLLKRAPGLMQVVIGFCQKSDAEIQKQRNMCTRANEKVLACFQKRWAENEALKKNLEQQIAEMEAAIVAAEKSLVRIKKRIDHYQEVDLQPKYDNAAAVLQKLRGSKHELEEDFHRKLVSLKIDECCRKITPERCTGQKPEDMACAAILENAQKKNLKKTLSSPAFTGTETIRPGSPLGQSSPLKSAGRVSINSSAA